MNSTQYWILLLLLSLSQVMDAATPKSTGTSILSQNREVLQLRDPFREPEIQVEKEEILTDLEKYKVTDYQVVGVITGPKRIRAMIKTPDGKTHMVGETMRLGLKKGVIRRITTESVIVREKVLNVFGEEEFVDTELMLYAQSVPTSSGGGNP
jgi:Tfp pilus assembly protein PilP